VTPLLQYFYQYHPVALCFSDANSVVIYAFLLRETSLGTLEIKSLLRIYLRSHTKGKI
jgi:hypothetical protein